MTAIKVPADLVRRIQERRCIAVVGSGLSLNAGLPDWRGALTKILEWADNTGHPIHDRDEIISMISGSTDGLLDVAADLADQLGPEAMRKALTATFRPNGLRPTLGHTRMACLPFEGIITTNFDKLIETAFAISALATPPVCTHAQTAELGAIVAGERPFILKAHGDIDHIDTIILGRRDYQELLLNAPYQRCMSLLCAQYTLLFLGFSLSDPDLRLTLDLHKAAFRDHVVQHYALVPGAGNVAVRGYSRAYGITLLTYQPSTQSHPEVEDFLENLERAVTSHKDPFAQLIMAQRSAESEIHDLEAQKEEIGAAERLRRLSKISVRLWDQGARMQAWTTLIGPFERECGALPGLERVEIGVRLGRMLFDDTGAESAARILESLIPSADQLQNGELLFEFWELVTRCRLRMHDLDGAKIAMESAIVPNSGSQRSQALHVSALEASLLAGRFDDVTKTLESGGDDA